jgi:hypothetical protein
MFAVGGPRWGRNSPRDDHVKRDEVRDHLVGGTKSAEKTVDLSG